MVDRWLARIMFSVVVWLGGKAAIDGEFIGLFFACLFGFFLSMDLGHAGWDWWERRKERKAEEEKVYEL